MADIVPVPPPFPAPGEGQLADGADLCGQVGFLAHLRHGSTLRWWPVSICRPTRPCIVCGTGRPGAEHVSRRSWRQGPAAPGVCGLRRAPCPKAGSTAACAP